MSGATWNDRREGDWLASNGRWYPSSQLPKGWRFSSLPPAPHHRDGPTTSDSAAPGRITNPSHTASDAALPAPPRVVARSQKASATSLPPGPKPPELAEPPAPAARPPAMQSRKPAAKPLSALDSVKRRVERAIEEAIE